MVSELSEREEYAVSSSGMQESLERSLAEAPGGSEARKGRKERELELTTPNRAARAFFFSMSAAVAAVFSSAVRTGAGGAAGTVGAASAGVGAGGAGMADGGADEVEA